MKTKLLTAVLSIVMLCTVLSVSVCASDSLKTSDYNVFSDVRSGDWYYGSVMKMYGGGLFTGTDINHFSPKNPMTRGMLVAVLARLDEADSGAYAGSDFSDVAVNSWYAPYVKWAYDTGVIHGYGDGTFGPEDIVTRAQMATMIANYIEKSNLELVPGNNVTKAFRDTDQVPAWARQGVEMMRSKGLIVGDTEGNCNPRAKANRAEAAMICARLGDFTVLEAPGGDTPLFDIEAETVAKIELWNVGQTVTITDREQIGQIVKDINAFCYNRTESKRKPDPAKEDIQPGLYGGLWVTLLDDADHKICSFMPSMSSYQFVSVVTETEIISYYTADELIIGYEYFEKFFPEKE